MGTESNRSGRPIAALASEAFAAYQREAGAPYVLALASHDLAELERSTPDGAPSTRLSSLSPSLAQDLMRFEQAGRAADLLEVLAACVRHGRNLTVHLRCLDKVLPLTLFPHERLAHCALDLRALVEQRRIALAVLQVEPAVLRPPGDPQATMVGEPRFYRPLSPLLLPCNSN